MSLPAKQNPADHGNRNEALVDAAGRRHGSLDGEAPNVLPALLQQRDEVVDGQHDVGDQLLLRHADVADGDTHAEHLLELELDGRLDLVHLAGEVVGVRDGRGELASCRTRLEPVLHLIFRRSSWRSLTLGETRTEDTGDLLDQGLGGDEGIVLARKLLDELLVLVELLEILNGHGVDTTVLGTVDIVLVTENAADSQTLRLGRAAGVDDTYQSFMLGRGTVGSLMVPEKLLRRQRRQLASRVVQY